MAGEVIRRVPSLAVPPPDHLPPDEELAQFEAVQLFVDRALAVQPDFAVTKSNALAVAQVCYRLDGIPLALELAAARLQGLTVAQVATRLDQRFRLLTGGSRTALPRQKTLRATIDWSYDLLSEHERQLFNRLSVFVGGWTLEAAEAVVGVGGWGLGVRERGKEEAGERQDEVPLRPQFPAPNPQPLSSPLDVLDLQGRLVEKSLVVAEPGEGGEARYRLLETLRQYGRERLGASGEAVAVHARHAAYYLAVAEESEHHLVRREQLGWLDRLETEHDNLRAALMWSLEGGDLQAGLRAAASLHMFWWIRAHAVEERVWFTEFLAALGAAEWTAARAKAQAWAGILTYAFDDWRRCLRGWR